MDRKTKVDLQTRYNQYMALADSANKIKLAVSIALVFVMAAVAKAINFASPYIAVVILLDLAAIIGARLLIGRYYAGKQNAIITPEEIQLARAINQQALSEALNGSEKGTEEQENGETQ